eukprot:scaffold171951_cov50-Attheya_sp.AAC.1
MEAATTPMKNPFVMEFEGVDGLYKFVYGMDVAISGVVMEMTDYKVFIVEQVVNDDKQHLEIQGKGL